MTEENNNSEAQAAGNAGQVQFALQKIYLRDLSFEAPLGAEAFRQQWQPKINQDLNTAVNQIEEGLYEVILKLTINVTLAEGDKTVFLVEVQQAGLFAIKGAEGPQLAHILNTACPNILFPYVREVIDNCAIKGAFPALSLPPINFEALFARSVQEAQKRQAADAPLN